MAPPIDPATTGDQSTGPIMQISQDLVFLAYPLNSEKIDGFKKFYQENIERWMKAQGVRHAHAYLAGSTLVVLASIRADVPWIAGASQIDGLKDFLDTDQPLNIQKLPVFYQE